MTTSPSVRWGFLGAGFVATRALASAVHSSRWAQLQAVGSRDLSRARALEPVGLVTDDYGSVIDDPAVDLVYIALSNEAHLPWILAAVEAGKHVVCEKPLALSAHDAQLAFRRADEQGVLLVEALWTRWHPRSRRVDALVATGELGPLDEAHGTFTFDGVPADNYRLDPARGGGALLDVGPYLIGSCVQLHVEPWRVERVTCRRAPTGVDLHTEAVLGGADGARADVCASFALPETQALVAHFREGTIELGQPPFTSWREPAELHLSIGEHRWTERFPSCDAYELMVSDVSRRVLGEDAFVLSARDSLLAAEAIDAIARAGASR